jgi:hypothetical protein
MKSKGQPRAAPTVFPLLSLQSVDSYYVFHISPSPRHEIAWGVPFIVGLGQDGSIETKFAVIGSTSGKMGPPCSLGYLPCDTDSFPSRGVPR